MTSKNTTLQQFDILVSFMEAHPDFAKGYNTTADARESSKRLWREIGDQLNSHGPPIRTPDGWKKVWTDFKYNIKRNVKENKQNISGTGGGPSRTHTFSALEETVILVTNLREAVNGITGAISLCDTQLSLPINPLSPPSDSHNLTNIELDDNSNEIIQPLNNRTNNRPNHNKTKNQLLENQIVHQKIFHDTVKAELTSISGTLIDTKEVMKRILKINEKKYDLYKKKILLKEKEIKLKEMELEFNRDKLAMEARDRLEERRCKIEELEIKKRKLELQEESDRSRN